MAMSVADAEKIVLMRYKLYQLRDKANSNDQPRIDAQLARLDPYRQQADNAVMVASDADFARVAKALKKQTTEIDAAIADIQHLSAALTQAAQIINGIVKAVGIVSKIL